MSNTIYYVNNSGNSIINLLQKYTKQQKFEWQPYDPTKLLVVEYLLIVKPILILDDSGLFKYCSYSGIWHRWCCKNAPNTKIIVVGYAPQQRSHLPHPNYWDALDLPNDITAALHRAQPAQYYAIKPTNPSLDSHYHTDYWHGSVVPEVGTIWLPLSHREQKPVLPERGANIIRRLKRFFDGHDRALSVENYLIALKQTLATAAFRLTEASDKEGVYNDIKTDLIDTYLADEWRELYDRWKRYYPFFAYTPFLQIENELNNKFNEIDEMIKLNKNKQNSDCVFKINKLLNEIDIQLQQQIHPYISEAEFLQLKPSVPDSHH